MAFRQERFGLDIRKRFFTERMVRHSRLFYFIKVRQGKDDRQLCYTLFFPFISCFHVNLMSHDVVLNTSVVMLYVK